MTGMFERRRSWLVAAAVVLVAIVLITAVALGRGAGGVAQAAGTGSGADEGGTITVNGQATIKATPDTVSISLGVQTQAPTAGEAMDQCSSAMSKVIDAIARMGVPRADIQTSNVYLSPQYQYDERGNPGKITGYQASNQVSCTWNQLDKIGDLIDAAVKAGANSIYGLGFGMADPSRLYLAALGDAVRDARAKADALAAAAGCRVGAVKSISADYSPGPILRKAFAMGAGGGTPIEPGTVEMQVNVNLQYAIE